MAGTFQSALIATQSYLDALRAIEDCRRVYAENGIELPVLLRSVVEGEPVQEPLPKVGVLHEEGEEEEEVELRPLPPPAMPKRPVGVPSSWIYIPLRDAMPSSLALAFVGQHLGPAPTARIVEYVREVSPDTAINTVYNALKRMTDNGTLSAGEDGFEVIKREEVGVISDDIFWGNPRYLFSQEIGRYRRAILIYALEQLHAAQLRELYRSMNASEWVKVPMTTDAVKQDIKFLEERGIVRRVRGTRRWELAPEEARRSG